jgi:signal transduction histidine kinase
MSKSHDRLLSEIRGLRKLLEALSRAQTIEHVYAFSLNAIHDIFDPHNAFVVLPEEGAKTFRANLSPEYQPGWITDLAVPVFLGAEAVGQFMLHFDSPRGFTELDLSLMETIAALTAFSLSRVRERHELRDAVRLKGESVAMAVHELRAPLTAIIGAAFLLRSDHREEHERAIEMIDRNARAQEQFIADLLNLSQLDAGKVELRLAVMDLVPIVEQVIEEIRPMAAAAAISVVTRLERPIMVRGDAQRLWQIFWNLLSNSVRFVASKGEIHVIATVEEGLAKVCVSDDGCGIHKERLPHIFERFEKAHDPRLQTYDGFGLGLAVVKEFVSMLGGTVTAESDGPGKGAAFTVRLPWVP